MSKQARRHFTAEKKAEILRRHFADKVAVSDLCDQYSIQPSVFYAWQRQVLENLASALQEGRPRRGEVSALELERQRVQALEARLARKNEVIAEISADNVALKKSLGEN